MKKLIVIMFCTTLVVLLAACAPAAAPPAPAPEAAAPQVEQAADADAPDTPDTPETDERVQLELWTWLAGQQHAIDVYQSLNPHVEIELVQMGHLDIAQRMLITIAAGSGAPDIFQQTARTFSSTALTGGLVDLTERYAPHRHLFSDAINGLISLDGRVYGIAPDISPAVIWYRRDIFEAYGVGEIETWNDFEAAGRLLRDNGYYIMPIFNPAGGWGANAVAMYMQSRGGNFFTPDGRVIENNEHLEFVMNWINRMYTEGIGIGLTFFTPEFWGEFHAGNIVAWPMNLPEGNNIRNNMPDQSGLWDVMPFPRWEGLTTHYTGVWGGTIYGIPAMSENIDEAFAYLEWIAATVEGQIAMFESWGSAPSNLEAITHERFSEGDPFFSGTNPLDMVNPFPVFFYFDFATVETLVGEQLDLMFAGSVDPTTAARNIEQNIRDATGR